jgi:hypothetical protein
MPVQTHKPRTDQQMSERLPVIEHPERSESLTLAALPTAISSARSFVVSTLERWRAPLAIGDAVLLVEEMVANAVRTTGVVDPAIQWKWLTHLELLGIRLVGLRRSIGIEVWDADRYPSDQLSPDNTVDSSLLAVLKSTAHQWGTIPAGRGKIVWAEMPVYERAGSGLPLRRRVPSPRPCTSVPEVHDLGLLQRVRDGLNDL